MEIEVERRVLEANDRLAAQNRRDFAARGVFTINVMSSPGAGKTTLLERTVEALKNDLGLAVIEGDVQTSRDAERIAEHDVQVVQINTRGACHLDASMVGRAAEALDLEGVDLLIIENVGNLVCPAEFDLGEAVKVMLLSTPEGEDKPAKYPLMFRLSQVLIINKIDLLPHLDFSLARVREEVASIQPHMEIFEVSALTGQGLEGWLDWLKRKIAAAKAARGG